MGTGFAPAGVPQGCAGGPRGCRCGRGGRVGALPAPGRAAEVTANANTDSHLALVVPGAGTETPVAVLPGGVSGRLDLR
ncbi:hypothetical protein MC885_021039 [Smutsia gigantea]|nr:hypothetical protein MC885_021039 [Smutsia gigantea]